MSEKGYYSIERLFFVKGKAMGSFDEKYKKIKENRENSADEYGNAESFSRRTERAGGQNIYSSKNKRKKSNALMRRIRHLKRSLTVDFDKPFDFYDQVLIMFVTLTVSCILFGSVFGVAALVHHGKNRSTVVAASESSDESKEDKAHSDDNIKKDKTVSEAENSAQPSDTSEEEESEDEDVSREGNQFFAETKTTVFTDKVYTGDLILVNKDHKCSFDGENVAPIIDSGEIYCALTDNNVSFDKERVVYLNKMLADFVKHYGDTDLMIACGYRSAKTQKKLLDNEIASVGKE